MSKKASFSRLYKYLKPYRKKLVLASISAILNKIFDIMPEPLIGIAVDVVVNRENSFLARFGLTDVMTQLYFIGGLIVVIWGLESLFEYIYEVLWRDIGQALQHDLRLATYDHLQHLELEYFEDKSTGGLLSILNNDINQLERFFDKRVAEFIHFLVGTSIVAGVFYYFSPMIAGFALLPLPVIIFITYWFKNRLGPLYFDVRKKAGELGGKIANNITGIATIKNYVTEKYELEKIANDSYAYLNSNTRVIRVSSAFIPVVRIAISFGFVATAVLGGYSVVTGVLPVGVYSALIFMTQRLLWPFKDLAKMIDSYERVMACATRIFAVLDHPVGIISGGQLLPKSEVKGDIVFNNVSFIYPNGVEIFHDLSLNIKAGKTVAFVGATGSGKSTIIKLLLRFYDATSGIITIDGYNIKSLKLSHLRHAIGLVSQDVFLFRGTVYENIAYGSSKITREQVEKAAKIAEAHDFIVELPDGYETMVGERGVMLSGGQRQRISIARAIVNDPPIFIFDEATSAVDNETEAAIQHSLDNISKDHTTIIIAHRLSTIRNADTIFVLEEGKIVESGSHDELVAKRGLYAALWKVQTGQH